MSRVLQVRRGTAAQNDNFTGLPGELSFDTDNKTLRVHDGVVLGGYELARTDQMSSAVHTAISALSDDFWTSIVNRNIAHPINIATTDAIAITDTAYIEHFCNYKNVLFAQILLVCQSDEHGYDSGDIVHAWGIGEFSAPTPNLDETADGTSIKIPTCGDLFWVHHKTSALRKNITPENWRIKMRIYYCNA